MTLLAHAFLALLPVLSSAERIAAHTAQDGRPLLVSAFDNGGFAARGPAGSIPARVTTNCRLVAGRRGQGVQIGDANTAGQLAYPAAEALRTERGTIEFWIKLNWDYADSTSKLTRVWFDTGTGRSRDRIYLHSNTGALVFGIFDSAGQAHFVQSRSIKDWHAGEWHQVTCSWDLSRRMMGLWFDGTPVGHTPSAAQKGTWRLNPAAFRLIRIGSFGNNQTPFDAVIDDLTIRGNARSDTGAERSNEDAQRNLQARQKQAAEALGALQRSMREAEAAGVATTDVWPVALAAETGIWRMSFAAEHYPPAQMRNYCDYVETQCRAAAAQLAQWMARNRTAPAAPPELRFPLHVEGDAFRDDSGAERLLVGLRNIQPYEFKDMARGFNLIAWNGNAPEWWIEKATAAGFAGQFHSAWSRNAQLRQTARSDPQLRVVDGRSSHNWGEDLCIDTPRARALIAQAVAGQRVVRRGGDPTLAYGFLSAEDTYMCYCQASHGLFRQWLQARYKTTARLNETWSSTHEGFRKIDPPRAEQHQAQSFNRAAWSDWLRFNLDRTTEFYGFLKRETRRGLPDLPLCTGTHLPLASVRRMSRGVDVESLNATVNDVLQCETVYRLPTQAPTPELPAYGIDIFGECGVDFQRSTSGKPATDLEFHAWLRYLPVLRESGKELPRGYTAAALYRHFLHGVRLADIWVWNRKPASIDDVTAFGVSPQVPLESVEECLRSALDVRRWAAEFMALSRTPADVAILLSDSTFLNIHPDRIARQATATPCTIALENAYHAALFLDAPVGYVTERSIAAGALRDYRIVLLPAVSHLPAATYDALMAFVERGGRLVVTPESLLFDEYHRPQPYLAKLLDIQQRTMVGAARKPTPSDLADPSYWEITTVNPDDARTPTAKLRTTEPTVLGAAPVALEGAGIRQTVQPRDGEVLAVFDDNQQPALIRFDHGQGHIYYLAITLRAPSYAALLDALMIDAEIARPVRVAGPDGRNAWGVEARACHYDGDLLLYAINLTTEPADIRLVSDPPVVAAHNLLANEPADAAMTLAPLETVLLRLKTAAPATPR